MDVLGGWYGGGAYLAVSHFWRMRGGGSLGFRGLRRCFRVLWIAAVTLRVSAAAVKMVG